MRASRFRCRDIDSFLFSVRINHRNNFVQYERSYFTLDSMSKLVASCYQQYKNDTRDLATWLAVAALNHGFPIDQVNRAPFDPIDGAVHRTAQQVKSAQKKAKQRARAKGKENTEAEKPIDGAERPPTVGE